MKYTIIGAGLVGALASIYLKKRGNEVVVYEKRKDLRTNPDERGRSINMALSDRGWLALEKVGMADVVKSEAIPMYGRMIHAKDGQQTFQAYGLQNQAIYSISRNKLTQILIDESEKIGVQFSFKNKIIDVDLRDKEVVFEQNESLHKIHYDCLIGTDGAFSEVRSVLTKTDRFDYHQWYLSHGYKELHIPAGASGEHQLDKNSLHIWPRGEFMLIALPNKDGSFTCTLFLPFEGNHSFQNLHSKTEILDFFKENFSDTLDIMPSLVDDFLQNPTSSLINVSCYPWTYKDSVVLMGDAAHAIVPFYGQGMNAGFEDVRVFDELFDLDMPFEDILKKYQENRKPNADAIAHMALENFIEMREKVGDMQFLLRKKIDAHLHQCFPEVWVPQYTLVTFSPHTSYVEALKKGNFQNSILDEILQIPDISNQWNQLDYTSILKKYFHF